MNNAPHITPFSARYDLIENAEAITYPDEEATMDWTMFEALKREFGNPVIGRISNLHYSFRPEKMMPKNAVAVPEDNHDDPQALLIPR